MSGPRAGLVGLSAPMAYYANRAYTFGEVVAPDPFASQPALLFEQKLIIRSQEALNLETPVHLLDSWITPVRLFFVRNHFAQPKVQLADWRMVVTGEVARPMLLTFRDLENLEPAAVIATLECAGSGRAFYKPATPGVQWERGSVGNAVFSGFRLADLLNKAGVKTGGKHVAFRGLDQDATGTAEFVRSIPIEKAMHPDTLLATDMNGAPLTMEHGFPVRAVVPGWLGAASVKWLTEIRVLQEEFDGAFMNPAYRYPTTPVQRGKQGDPAESAAITTLPVKAIITGPPKGAYRKQQPLIVSGAAWSGEAEIAGVEVSTDGGNRWEPAMLDRTEARYAWRFWEHMWTPPAAGSYLVMCRATDRAGRTQPAESPWNPHGYLWNQIDRVEINVRD